MRLQDSASRQTVRRWFYSQSIAVFQSQDIESIIGELTMSSGFDVTATQRDAWIAEILAMRMALAGRGAGRIYFEYDIPRLGRRIDVLLVLDHVIFVIEFKVGETTFSSHAVDQVLDYALDLRNFHETSHTATIVPMLVANQAHAPVVAIVLHGEDPLLPNTVCVGQSQIAQAIDLAVAQMPGESIDGVLWETGRYLPTPTIIEAARALYSRHSVESIARNDAGAVNLTRTAAAVEAIVDCARAENRKTLCLVTGVPGAGKTLVGLNVATRHRESVDAEHSVFLSGNGPLVRVLREALARDAVANAATHGARLTKSDARRPIDAFIQNVHHFRDECLRDPSPPADHVALFDEAQRAWDLEQTRRFMKLKKDMPEFDRSEPEFLISCLDRHPDWAVVVGLIGSGQEINTGEAGVSEWIESILRSFPDWRIQLSPRLGSTQFLSHDLLARLNGVAQWNADLHLSTSMRSFRAERLSDFVHSVLALEADGARELHASLQDKYPIFLTRSLPEAKDWVRMRARGSERYGLVASSQAQRLKPHAVNVRTKVDPVHWFLHGKSDVRSSFFMEDPATEFLIQGLELDWACVVWDGDLRHARGQWSHNEFRGNKWIRIQKPDRKQYLQNAYRVLLTRARQGMVIVVPEGAGDDATRSPKFYDPTYAYLESLGIRKLEDAGAC